MTEIEDLQRRLREALARIGAAAEGLEPPRPDTGADPAEIAALREALTAERETSQNLEERLHGELERVETLQASQRADLDRLRQELSEGEMEAQRLRRINAELRQSIQALREAAEAGLSDPSLIDRAMRSELEGLRAARDGDRAEMDAILSELKPLVEERNDA